MAQTSRSLRAVSLIVGAWLSLACLWERDTLEIERRGLPGAHEAIVGLAPQHAREVYEARIQELASQETWLSAAELDDLAVAHERLGERAQAERILLGSAKRHGERYETLANLGTVLAHSGRHAEGLAYLERAVALNPDAHFGREWVQIALIRYLAGQPISEGAEPPRPGAPPRFDLLRQIAGVESAGGWSLRVMEGLVGIVVMGGPPHPLVYWSLAHELERSGQGQLALYAEARVLELDPDWYADHDRLYAGRWEGAERPDVSAEFARMRADADEWVADYHNWQRAELAAGRDPTASGAWESYLVDHPQPSVEESLLHRVRTDRVVRMIGGLEVLVGLAGGAVGVVVLGVWVFRRRG